jgi:fucose permease
LFIFFCFFFTYCCTGIPVLLSFLSGYYSFEIILQGTGVVMLAGILFCLGVRFPAPKQPQGFPIKEGLGLLKESSLLLLSFILFFQSGIEGVCNNWTTLYLGQTTNIPENRALMALTCMVAGLTVARLLLVVLFKKIKQETVLRASLITAAIGFALLTFSPDFARAAIGMVLVGAGLASTFPVILSIVGSRYASLSGTAFSVALVIALIGQTLLNSLTVIISQGYSIVVYPYMMIASLLIMLLLFKRSLK